MELRLIEEVISKYPDANFWKNDLIVDCASSETLNSIVNELGILEEYVCDTPIDHKIFLYDNSQYCLVVKDSDNEYIYATLFYNDSNEFLKAKKLIKSFTIEWNKRVFENIHDDGNYCEELMEFLKTEGLLGALGLYEEITVR